MTPSHPAALDGELRRIEPAPHIIAQRAGEFGLAILLLCPRGLIFGACVVALQGGPFIVQGTHAVSWA